MPPASEPNTASSESTRLKEVAGFEIVSKIGQGGMGTVFKARQKSLDRIVALKILPPSIAKNERYIERFQREARASAKLDHPNIVMGIDVGKDPKLGLWYFAMEYIDGPSLKHVLKEKQVLEEAEALRIVLQVAQALCAVHTAQIVHRDIKPDNILLTSRGEAKLADLGLAKDLDGDAEMTQTGQALGTPHYMAPEQVRGQSDQMDIRSDIYALGGTLFHLVTGKTPFSGETSAVVLAAHLNTPAPKASAVNPHVSEGCSNLIRRMMAKKREERVQTPAELVALITKLQAGGNITGKRTAIHGAITGHRPAVKDSTTGKRTAIQGAVTGHRPAVKDSTTGPRTAVSGKRPAVNEATTGPRAAVGNRTTSNSTVVEKPISAPRSPRSMLPTVLGGAAAAAILVCALVFSGGSKPVPKEAGKPPAVAIAPERPFIPPAPVEKPKPVEEPKPTPVVEVPKAPPPPEPAKPVEAPKTVEPAKPVEPVKAKEPEVDLAAAKLAYARFQEEFLALLTQSKVPEATELLSKTEKDGLMKPLQSELAQDRAALGWLAEADAALLEGAKKLAKVDQFELRLNKGSPMKVGEKQEFKVGEVTSKAISVGARGMAVQVQIARLHASTRRRLVELGWGETPESLPRLALITLLEVRLGENDGPTPAAVKLWLDKASAANSRKEEIAYVQRLLDSSLRAVAEQAAQSAWPELPRLAGEKQWKALLAAVDKYQADHGATQFAQGRQKELAEFRRLVAANELPSAGLTLWLRADGELKTQDGAVVQWADASGQQHHAIAEKPDARPMLVPNALEGRPALHFDGENDSLKIPGISGEMTSFTVMWTLRPVTLKNWNQAISAGGGWGEFVFHATENGGVFVGTSVQSRISPGEGPHDGTVEKNVWQQFAYVVEAGKAKFYKNGTLLATRDMTKATWNGFVIGGYEGGNTIHGDMSELLIYTRALNDDERQMVEKHLMRKAR